MFVLRFAALAVLIVGGTSSPAQVLVTAYGPAIVAPAPVVAYRPVVPTVAYLPTVAVAPAPVIVRVPPAVAVTRAVAPAPVVTTRFRPILGGTVTRVRYRYAPATVVTPVY